MSEERLLYIIKRITESKDDFTSIGEYKGYLMFHQKWVNTLGEIRHNVVALKVKPKNLNIQTLYNQAWEEDEKFNSGRGYPLFSTEYSTREDAEEVIKHSIDMRHARDNE